MDSHIMNINDMRFELEGTSEQGSDIHFIHIFTVAPPLF